MYIITVLWDELVQQDVVGVLEFSELKYVLKEFRRDGAKFSFGI